MPSDDIGLKDWPCSVLIPCGMGDARNLLMALAGDACLVIGGRAGTISEVCLAWLHHRPLLPLTGCGGWSDGLERNPPDERGNSKILSWNSIDALRTNLRALGLIEETPLVACATSQRAARVMGNSSPVRGVSNRRRYLNRGWSGGMRRCMFRAWTSP